jgi:hypothetical protein
MSNLGARARRGESLVIRSNYAVRDAKPGDNSDESGRFAAAPQLAGPQYSIASGAGSNRVVLTGQWSLAANERDGVNDRIDRLLTTRPFCRQFHPFIQS